MKNWLALMIGVVCVATSPGIAKADEHTASSASSIGPEERAVYEAVLASWLGADRGRQLVSIELSAPPTVSDAEFKECAKGLNFSPGTQHEQGQKSLTGVHFNRNGIELIEQSHWSAHDPGQGIAKGQSVESAVTEGFSNSLISFSQISFSQDGQDALVRFSMACGSLCGSGSTMHLHKSGVRWEVIDRCEGWIS